MLTLVQAKAVLQQLREAKLAGDGFKVTCVELERPEGQEREAILTVTAFAHNDRRRLLVFSFERERELAESGLVVEPKTRRDKLMVVFK